MVVQVHFGHHQKSQKPIKGDLGVFFKCHLKSN